MRKRKKAKGKPKNGKKKTNKKTAQNCAEGEFKNEMGRPEIISDEGHRILVNLAAKGLTDRELADAVGIGERTLYSHKKRHPEFRHALKEAKKNADKIIERTLYQRAIGYTCPEEKIFCTKDGDVIRADTIKHYPPDTTACIFWLKNRQPEKWREKSEMDHTSGGQDLVKLIQAAEKYRAAND